MSSNHSPEPDAGRILIVDDHPTNIDVLYDFLQDRGYEVLVAEDGKSALERVKFAKPDLILLDIMMPDIDGYQTCAELKASADTCEIPVIYITALTSLDDKMRGFDLGAVDYITKPFQNQEVLARVRTHMSLKLMREELERHNERLLVQNEALDAYARTVAHDLKNPLNLILNYARLIQEDDKLQGMSRDDLDNLILGAERMDHIIQDLLLLAQIQKDEVAPIPVNMNAALKYSLLRLEVDLAKSGGKLVQPKELPNVLGVSSWIQAIWVNYISNAIKYGGYPPYIEIVVEENPDGDGRHRFGVKDRGTGIPPSMYEKVFAEFSRIGAEKEEGHGIGLSICKRIAHKLGGQVSVRNNEDGPGCTFFFTLPMDDRPS